MSRILGASDTESLKDINLSYSTSHRISLKTIKINFNSKAEFVCQFRERARMAPLGQSLRSHPSCSQPTGAALGEVGVGRRYCGGVAGGPGACSPGARLGCSIPHGRAARVPPASRIARVLPLGQRGSCPARPKFIGARADN